MTPKIVSTQGVKTPAKVPKPYPPLLDLPFRPAKSSPFLYEKAQCYHDQGPAQNAHMHSALLWRESLIKSDKTLN